MITGWKGCIGCDWLKMKIVKNPDKYKKIAKYFWISTLVDGSYLFYTTLGIPKISSAPQLFFINPKTNATKRLNANDFDEVVPILGKEINW